MRWVILLFALTLLVQIGNVEAKFKDDGSCEIGTYCNFTILVVNESTSNPINDAYCNMTIYDKDGLYLREDIMDNISTAGIWANNISFSSEGSHNGECFCQYNNDPNHVDIADCSFVIGSPENYNRLLHALFILLPLSLIGLAKKTEIIHFATLGSILMILFGITLFTGGFPHLEFQTNNITNAFAIIVTGLGTYLLLLSIQEYWYMVEQT